MKQFTLGIITAAVIVLALRAYWPASQTDLVNSWSNYVDAQKSNAIVRAKEWNEANPKLTVEIEFLKDDIKETESLKSPIRGELIVRILKKDLSLLFLNLEAQRMEKIAEAVRQVGERLEAEGKIPPDRTNDEPRAVKNIEWRECTEYSLQFSPAGKTWVFSQGEGRVTLSRDQFKVGSRTHFSTLNDDLKKLLGTQPLLQAANQKEHEVQKDNEVQKKEVAAKKQPEETPLKIVKSSNKRLLVGNESLSEDNATKLVAECERLARLQGERARRFWWNDAILVEFTELRALSPAVAKLLARCPSNLCFNRLAVLEPDAAKELAEHKGNLTFLSLSKLSSESAKAVAQHQGSLVIDSLSEISIQAEKELAKHAEKLGLRLNDGPPDGKLAIPALTKLQTYDLTAKLISCGHDLRGCRSLNPEAARALHGKIDLSGLKELTPELARSLHCSILILGGLTSLSPDTRIALLNNKNLKHVVLPILDEFWWIKEREKIPEELGSAYLKKSTEH